MLPLNKYKFFYDGKRRIIAVSTYAGKTVRGVATCHEDDDFDFEKGKRIAAARCELKVAEKRAKRASDKVEQAKRGITNATAYLWEMERYLRDADVALDVAIDNLNDIILEVK